MLFHMDGESIQTLRTLSVLVFLTLFCPGQSQLIGSSRSIVATLGADITLPCHLEPAEDATDLTLEWTRPDLYPRFVHVWRSGQELVDKKNKLFKGRTSLLLDELKFGNISLKLSKVGIADRGTYKCFIPALDRQTFVQLLVASGAVSSPVINLPGIDRNKGGVVLDCESAGWYPEPEVLWLDGEGNLLSAGPTETVRGPDDLYTVSSRVTVEKRHSNSFTCRVQQKDTNQMRQTHITVADDFFEVQSNHVPVIIGLAVSLAVWIILLFLLLFFFVWKWRQKITSFDKETKRSHVDGSETGEKNNCSETNRSEDQLTEEEREKQQLMAAGSVQTVFKEEGEKTINSEDKLAAASDLSLVDDQVIANKEEIPNEVRVDENDQDLLPKLEANQAAPAPWFFSSWFQSDSKRESLKKELDQQRWTEEEKDDKHEKELLNVTRKWQKIVKEETAKTEKAEKQLEVIEIQWQKLLQEEMNKRENPERELENLKEPETKVHATRCEVQENLPTSQSSATGPVIVDEIGKCGRYIRLKNTSDKEKPLGGWYLHMQVNDRKPIMYTFDKSFKVSSGKTSTISVPGFGSRHNPVDLVWQEMKTWSFGDKLKVSLISNTGEIQHQLSS